MAGSVIDERRQAALDAIKGVPGLSDRARLLYGELESRSVGSWVDCPRQELADVLHWSVRKLGYALTELIKAGLIERADGTSFRICEEALAHAKTGGAKGIMVVSGRQRSPLDELVAHYVKTRLVDPPTSMMYSRLRGEAKRSLKDNDLHELMACIDWLNKERWWSKQNWSLSAVAGQGLIQFRAHRRRLPTAPGAAVVKEGVPDFSIGGPGSLIPKEFRD